jgi:hypothetical protein
MNNNSKISIILITAPLMWFGCAPSVQLTTPEPLKVDITMTVDVNQKSIEAPKTRIIGQNEAKAMQRREQRSGEIWSMKNDGVAIEGENGYLQANPKTGWDPQYVNQVVVDENQDRHTLYEAEARDDSRPIRVVEEEAGKLLKDQTYLGHTNQVKKVTVP